MLRNADVKFFHSLHLEPVSISIQQLVFSLPFSTEPRGPANAGSLSFPFFDGFGSCLVIFGALFLVFFFDSLYFSYASSSSSVITIFSLPSLYLILTTFVLVSVMIIPHFQPIDRGKQIISN